MNKQIRHDPAQSKEDRIEKRLEEDMRNHSDVVRFTNSNRVRTRIIFVNIGLGEQTTAKNFWVSIPRELKIEDIRNRVEKAFGDLNGNT